MLNKKIFLITIILVTTCLIFTSCGQEAQDTKEGRNKGQATERLDWVENSLTQPLPAGASTTRLGLPAEREDLMPDGAPITAFGTHIGQHAEGMDHSWTAVKEGTPAKSMGEGNVTSVIENAPGEYFIYLDYGDGLTCAYGEISQPLVDEGQTVKHLDPIGEINKFQQFAASEIEIYCNDANRDDGIKSTFSGVQAGSGISEFDYLNDADKAWLEETYKSKVIDAYLAGQDYGQAWFPGEPWLHNQMMVHEEDKVTGEWFLVDKKWNDEDNSLVILLPSANEYYDKNDAHLRVENADLMAKNYVDGTYEVEYKNDQAQIVITETRMGTKYYALAEVTEDAGTDANGDKRAQMKLEISSSPITEFSNKALTYQERGVYNPRYDAWKLGGWTNYQ
ncbi:M23 family metallopeptidase [Patescibacteria group bacterium]